MGYSLWDWDKVIKFEHPWQRGEAVGLDVRHFSTSWSDAVNADVQQLVIKCDSERFHEH